MDILCMHYLWSLGINKSLYLCICAVAMYGNSDLHVQPVARSKANYQDFTKISEVLQGP